jgi:ectoine hydroxylase-related dioxygenase (phytanoyl-CoA dioxygenase family)
MSRTMADIKHVNRQTSPEEISDILKTDGGLIVDGLMPDDLLEQLRSEIMPFVEATDIGRDDFTGRHTTRTGALVARSEACRKLVMDPTILGAANAFIGPFCDRIQLHLTQLIRIQHGQQRQPLHRDRLAWGGYLQRAIEPQFNTIWAVSDFTEDNGATLVAPGSNTWEDETRLPTDDEIGFAEMQAGSVLVYSGSVTHGGGANNSGADRMGLNITYALGWLRQEENQYLSCPPEIAKDLDPELRALLGYAMGSYALGYYTPPLPAGEGPEVVPPDFLFGEDAKAWGDDLYDQVTERVKAGETGG